MVAVVPQGHALRHGQQQRLSHGEFHQTVANLPDFEDAGVLRGHGSLVSAHHRAFFRVHTVLAVVRGICISYLRNSRFADGALDCQVLHDRSHPAHVLDVASNHHSGNASALLSVAQGRLLPTHLDSHQLCAHRRLHMAELLDLRLELR